MAWRKATASTSRAGNGARYFGVLGTGLAIRIVALGDIDEDELAFADDGPSSSAAWRRWTFRQARRTRTAPDAGAPGRRMGEEPGAGAARGRRPGLDARRWPAIWRG